MKLCRRMLGFLLCGVLLLHSLIPALAGNFEWTDESGGAYGYVCDDCGDAFFDEEGNVCPLCDSERRFCESCFCSSCGRCYEHCICDMQPEDYMDLEEELDAPEIPADDFPEAQSLAEEDLSSLACVDESLLSDPLSENYTYFTQVMEKLCAFTAGDDSFAAVDSCVETIRRVSETRELLHTVDTANPFVFRETDPKADSNATAKFIEALGPDSEVMSVIRSRFNWDVDEGIFSKAVTDDPTAPYAVHMNELQSATDQLLEALKALAVSSGFEAYQVEPITVKYVDDSGLSNSGALGEYHWESNEIRKSMDDLSSGNVIALTIAHEFVHALDYLSTGMITGAYSTVRDFRLGLSQLKLSTQMETPLGYATYMVQLEERMPRYAETQLDEKKDGDQADLWLIEHFGPDVSPLMMEAINARNGFEGESLRFIRMLEKSVPEMGLIPADIDLRKLDLTYPDGISAKMEDKSVYLVRCLANNGVTYIVPTYALTNMLEKIGFDLGEYYMAVANALNEPGKGTAIGYYDVILKSMAQSDYGQVQGPKTEFADPTPPPFEGRRMTADEFLWALSLAAAVTMDESCKEDPALMAEYTEKLEQLAKEADYIQTLMEYSEDLDSLQDDYENAMSDGEYLQEDLRVLLEEYASQREEYEETRAEYEDELAELRESLMEDARCITDDAEDMTPEELEAYYEQYSEEYRERKGEMEADLELIADDLDSLEQEIASTAEDLEQLTADIAEAGENINQAAAESQELQEKMQDVLDDMEALDRLMQEAGSQSAVDRDFERRVHVCVTNKDGVPVVGAPIYVKVPGSQTAHLVGKTDSDGMLIETVDISANSGLTLSVGTNGKSYRSADGTSYGYTQITDLPFTVVIEDGTPVFELEGDLEVPWDVTSSIGSNSGGLRVTIRAYDASMGSIKDWSKWELDGSPRLEVPWTEFYDKDFYSDPIKSGSVTVYSFWRKELTEENANYYGAYLIPLSDDGNLPRTDAEIRFAPLYKWENGGPRLQLKKSSDFNNGRAQVKNQFDSYCFDFGSVHGGRYELIIIMPDSRYSYHFQEIYVRSPGGSTLPVMNRICAQTWTSKDNGTDDPTLEPKNFRPNPRLATVSIDPEVQTLQGRKIDSLTAKNNRAVFAVSVDPTGKTAWCVAKYTGSGRLQVPVGKGFAYSGWDTGSEGDSYETGIGQIYLFADLGPDVRLLPVTYGNTYLVRKDEYGQVYGKKYTRSDAGKIYALSSQSKKDAEENLPLYVAFWEQYFDAEGKAHYRTYDRSVSFELHWETDRLLYGEALDYPHLSDPISTNAAGSTVNYLHQRKLTVKGASYSFTYYGRNGDIWRGEKTLEEMPVDACAERIMLEDGEETLKVFPDGITGTALMTETRVGENGEKQKYTYTVYPQIAKDHNGMVLRFIVGTDCSAAGHEYYAAASEATCTEAGEVTFRCLRCGFEKTEHCEALGHLQDPKKSLVSVSGEEHGYVCLRCGETIPLEAHAWGTPKETKTCTEHKVTRICKVCGAIDEKVEEGDWHTYEERSECWYDPVYHWHICKKCGQPCSEPHKLYDDGSGSIFCEVCNYEKLMGGLGFYLSVDRNVCCPHVTMHVSYSLSDPAEMEAAEFTRRLWWEFGCGETVTPLDDGSSTDFDLSEVKEDLFRLDDSGQPGAVRCRMYWGANKMLASQWIPVQPMKYVEGTPATCSQAGTLAHWLCSCGATCDEDGHIIDISIPALEHTYSDDCDTDCDVCGQPRKVSHRFGSEYESREGGYHCCLCEDCGAAADVNLPCTPSEWIVDAEPSCETEGQKHKECTVCGVVLLTEAIPAQHAFGAYTRNPDTGSHSTAAHTCDACGTTVVEKSALPIHHVRTYVEGLLPTCTAPGSLGYYVCEDCGVISLDKKGTMRILDAAELEIPIDPQNHAKGEMLWDEREHWYACACGEKLDCEEHVFDVDGHCTICGCGRIEELPKAKEDGFPYDWAIGIAAALVAAVGVLCFFLIRKIKKSDASGK